MSVRQNILLVHGGILLVLAVCSYFLLEVLSSIVGEVTGWTRVESPYVPFYVIPLLMALVVVGGILLQELEHPKSHAALLWDGDCYDLGQGIVSLGLLRFLGMRIEEYSLTPMLFTSEIDLPTKDGSILCSNCHVTWVPDRKKLGEFFTVPEWSDILKPTVLAQLQSWSKSKLPQDIYFADSPVLKPIPGIITTVQLTDIFGEGGDMKAHVRDNSRLIESVVADIQDEVSLEAKQTELETQYPDKVDRIRKLIGQRKAELIRRGMK